MNPLDDYIDADVAYFLGLVIARGTLTSSGGLRQIIIEFPHSSLDARGITSHYDQNREIRLGIESIRERLIDLLDADVATQPQNNNINLVVRFTRNNMIWRNLLLQTGGATSFPHFHIPQIIFSPDLPRDWKVEFVRGYADVAGNIRPANRYVNNCHRVRLDVLNSPTNWSMPVQLCTLLQGHLEVPVQNITWGHPNMGREWREHQVNVFANDFQSIGFSFDHKRRILQELIHDDEANGRVCGGRMCPGIVRRDGPAAKALSPDEHDAARLDPRLLGQHFDAYYQVCARLGCTRVTEWQLELDILDDPSA